MYFLRRAGIYLIIILAIMSIYNDLTSGTSLLTDNKPPSSEHAKQQNTKQFTVVKVKVQAGDTVLSIVEEVNQSLSSLDMKQIFTDFQLINHADPHQLNTGDYYYFPLYAIVP